MEIEVLPGRYVVAVSGGVDSMVLLNLLRIRPDVRLTIAHFDHGIREDSIEDRRLVQDTALHARLPFVYHKVNLGRNTSEAVARQARYEFLHHVRRSSGADAILTAHHQDDVLETTLLNLLRGTGRRGLSSLKSTDVVKRPLLNIPKSELLRYAEQNDIKWREDSTNDDMRYERNYVRRCLLPRFAEADRQALLKLINDTARLNEQIEAQTANYLHLQPSPDILDRQSFISLPHNVAKEVLAEWLRAHTGVELSKNVLERLAAAAKVGRSGTKVDVDKQYWLEISRKHLALKARER